MIIYEKKNLRISLLTSRLLRTEKGSFTDLPTQTIQNRDFDNPKYTIIEDKNRINVQTDDVLFSVSLSDGSVTYAHLKDGKCVRNFGANVLPGTARTLDTVNGATKLENGIISRGGTSIYDDSKSLVIGEDGTPTPRQKCSDRYWFAYGHDYLAQLQDFFKLTGEVPLIPKYALGNWWSRYRAYTQEEYRTLMQKFIDRELPITVATIDMDWHWVDVIKRFGKEAGECDPKSVSEAVFNAMAHGWTGYSWNTELFPDHVELLSWLHDKGFKVPLNIHPSQGVRFFEDAYEDMCKALGKDPEKKELIPFDITDKDFVKAYFECLHHPLEREGVDFWWIDWQQGTKTKIEGLDPLWALNHYHYLDSANDGKRPMILSRYAGLGSHRYPLGFSGDTHCTWASLDFQPYFTNCAANAGYTWWSHDIGGHMHGVQDDELYLRWLQLGVFSPINRLHSSNSDFMGKEPWKRSWAVCEISERFLRLRHKLIPYLYTANYRTHKYGEPICMPMYYRYDCEEAYKAKNQFIFGGSLIVCPITKPSDKKLNLASVDVWLPEGRWTDIFNGRIYKGGRWVKMYRDLDSIPVLAPAGAIVPMYKNDRTNDLSLAQPLEIKVWRGNGHYSLYEDDGETMDFIDGKFALTELDIVEENGNIRLTITPPKDNKILPESREMLIKFCDIEAEDILMKVGKEPVIVEIENFVAKKNENFDELKGIILTRVQGKNDEKSMTYGKLLPKFVADVIAEFDALEY